MQNIILREGEDENRKTGSFVFAALIKPARGKIFSGGALSEPSN